MHVDRVARLVYKDPIVVHRIKMIERQQNTDNWPRKTPVRQIIQTYDQTGKLVTTEQTLSAFA